MKRYIKNFFPDFRCKKGPDCSFELTDFGRKDFECPIGHESGIYIISTTNSVKFKYANGKESPIIYIGKSDDLLRRLRGEHYTKHLKVLEDNPDYGIAENFQMSSKYQYMYYNGCQVDVYKCRGKQESKELESIFLNAFYQHYRSIPVGNAARSFWPE